MDEIVRRLRENKVKKLKFMREAEDEDDIEDEELDKEDMDSEEYTPPEEEVEEPANTPPRYPTEENSPEEEIEEEPVEEPEKKEEVETTNSNPLDNPYAVHRELGETVMLAYVEGANTEMVGTVEGYDKEGFYRIKWSDGNITNGITDIALADMIENPNENTCVCGSTNFVNENNRVVCDECGRVIRTSVKEFKDPLTIADKKRPKGKRLVRSEAHDTSTVMKPSISEAIKKAFNTSKTINEDAGEGIFNTLISELSREFWTRRDEMVSDIEDLGYEVVDANDEYIVVQHPEYDIGYRIPLGGTSRTMFLDFDRAKTY